MSTLADVLRWGRGQFSLDPQPEQDFLSPQTAGDMALGMIPGVGQAMALRDMERARRAEDPVAGGLAAASLLPFGKLAGALKNKIIAGGKALKAPLDDLAAGEAALKAGKDPDEVWKIFGVQQGMENHRPMQWEIPDQKSKVSSRAFDKDQFYMGDLDQVLSHPEVYANYPGARKIQLVANIDPTLPEHKVGGAFYEGAKGRPSSMDVVGRNEDELRTIILHELNHGVAALEGFDRGASPSAAIEVLRTNPKYANLPENQLEALAFNKYRSNIGENASFNVEERAKRPAHVNTGIRPTSEYYTPAHKLTPDYELSENQLKAMAKKLRQVAPSD